MTRSSNEKIQLPRLSLIIMASLNAYTHDTSLIDYHVKNIEFFGRTLDRIGAAAFPRSGRSRYREAHVLLLSWQDDDLGKAHLMPLFNRLIHLRRHQRGQRSPGAAMCIPSIVSLRNRALEDPRPKFFQRPQKEARTFSE